MGNKKTGKAWRADQIAKHAQVVEYIRQLVSEGYKNDEIAAKLCVPKTTVKLVRKSIDI